jgi:hypothetical protein
VPTYTWISLWVFLAVLVLGTVWVTINGLRAWRRGRPSLKRMTATSAELNARAMGLEQRLAVLETKTGALQRDVGRLSGSLARANVLFGAVKEAKTAFDRTRLFIPGA